MKRIRDNILIVVSYFIVLLALTFNKSGGDILLIFVFLIIAVIHLIILTILYLRKQITSMAFIGFLLGILVALCVFKTIDLLKAQKPSETRFGYPNN